MKGKVASTIYTGDEILQRRIETVCDGLLPNVAVLFVELSEPNKRAIADFILDLINRKNIAVNTKATHIKNLVYLIRNWKGMDLKDMKREHVDSYLQGLRRSKEKDPDEKWISTHNSRATTYSSFFRYHCYPDMEPEKRVRQTPDVVAGITFFRRKSKTHVKPTHLWLAAEDEVFLKYCPDQRVSFYHVAADDTSGRPHEILAKRIGDVKIIKNGTNVYAEMEIGRGGKTRPRVVPLIKSLPYFKALLQVHPRASDPNAFIFYNNDQRSRYLNKPIKPISLYRLYRDLKLKYYPALLERADVPEKDKAIIRALLQKPWNPYIQRHTALTEKARILKEYNLRQHAGWTKTSQMIEIYTHDLGGESAKELLAAYGIIDQADPQRQAMQPRICPACKEPNKHDARFCSNKECEMPLTMDSYQEVKERERQKEKQAEEDRRKLHEVYQAAFEAGLIKGKERKERKERKQG